VSERTLAAYRDDGFSVLRSLICSSDSTLMLKEGFPPRGFVGLGSVLSVDTDPDSFRLKSIHLRRTPSTHAALLWRLTCEWETSPQALPLLKLGPYSGASGRRSGGAGAGRSPRPTSITSTSKPLTYCNCPTCRKAGRIALDPD